MTMKKVAIPPRYLAYQVSFLNPEKIRDFLSKYKGGENDLARGFANIGIDDSDIASHRETLSLKYMYQLVRVILIYYT